MGQTLYNEDSELRNKPQNRFITPCQRLVKRDLQTTYHSPYDKEGKVSLSSFLGLDYRGVRAYNKLRKNVIKKTTDEHGQPSGKWLFYLLRFA